MLGFITIALLPLLVTTFTGDVSRYLPSTSFSAGLQGKDEIIIASAATTLLVVAMLAGVLIRIIKIGWRKLRARTSE